MRELDQEILKFNHDQNFKYEDFYVSKSNEHVFNFINKWPKWEKNFLNISGEKFSGKTHLINIFLKKFKGIKLDSKKLNTDSLNHKHLQEIKINQNIVLENFNEKIDEKLVYSLFNNFDSNFIPLNFFKKIFIK